MYDTITAYVPCTLFVVAVDPPELVEAALLLNETSSSMDEKDAMLGTLVRGALAWMLTESTWRAPPAAKTATSIVGSRSDDTTSARRFAMALW